MKASNSVIRVMGIDPGIASTGYGVVSYDQGKLALCCSGSIRTSSKLTLDVRLQQIYLKVQECIQQYQPQAVAFEELFVARNYKMAIDLGQALGAAKIAAVQMQLPVFGYSVLNIKQAVVGYGRADKSQVQAMVKILLKLDNPLTCEHEADALAVAICHLHTSNTKLQSKT